METATIAVSGIAPVKADAAAEAPCARNPDAGVVVASRPDVAIARAGRNVGIYYRRADCDSDAAVVAADGMGKFAPDVPASNFATYYRPVKTAAVKSTGFGIRSRRTCGKESCNQSRSEYRLLHRHSHGNLLSVPKLAESRMQP